MASSDATGSSEAVFTFQIMVTVSDLDTVGKDAFCECFMLWIQFHEPKVKKDITDYQKMSSAYHRRTSGWMFAPSHICTQ